MRNTYKLYELFIYPTESGNLKLTIYYDSPEYEVFAEMNHNMAMARHSNKRVAVKMAIEELILSSESV